MSKSIFTVHTCSNPRGGFQGRVIKRAAGARQGIVVHVSVLPTRGRALRAARRAAEGLRLLAAEVGV